MEPPNQGNKRCVCKIYFLHLLKFPSYFSFHSSYFTVFTKSFIDFAHARFCFSLCLPDCWAFT